MGVNSNMWGGSPPGHKKGKKPGPKPIGYNGKMTKWDTLIGVEGGFEAAVNWYRAQVDPATGKLYTSTQIARILSEQYGRKLSSYGLHMEMLRIKRRRENGGTA